MPTPPEFSFDVFLSHNAADKPRVRRLAERLRAAGLRVWFDEWVIKPGDDIYLAIEHGLEVSRTLVLCLSQAALGSGWVSLERSTALFRDPRNAERRFIPLLLADCHLPDSMRRYRYIDFRQEDAAAFEELLSSCRPAGRMPSPLPKPLCSRQCGRDDFARLAQAYCHSSIDEEARRRNLAKGDWRYDQQLLPALLEHGWVRFAAGFKSGIYAHPDKSWCIKILGMGVGDDPSFFAGRGYYNEHERHMLDSFARHGFTFQPRVLPVDGSIAFLVEECGVQPDQAAWQCRNHHILFVEKILGVPFATATGRFLRYEPDIAIFDSGVLRQCEQALCELTSQLDAANNALLLHNDPVPANIIFAIADADTMVARLVDFELAQDRSEASPDYVSNSVRELYAEREVPINVQTGQHTKNLDQHLMEQSLKALIAIRQRVEEYESACPGTDRLSFSYSFPGGISINLGDTIRLWHMRAGVR